MNLVDTSGWLEFYSDGANASHFEDVLKNESELLVSTINIYEVYKKIYSQKGETDAIKAITFMMRGKLIDVSHDIAVRAAKYSSDYKMPMADALILSTARINNAVLWTQDIHFKGLDNVNFFPKL